MQDAHTQTPPEPAVQDADAKLRSLRAAVAELAAGEGMEKATALRVVQLHHEMESLLEQERAAREVELVKLRGDLERFHLQAELDRLARKSVVSETQLQQLAEVHGRTARR